MLVISGITYAGGSVWGSDAKGTDKYYFKPGETVYVTWASLGDPDGVGDFYTVYSRDWKSGDPITGVIVKKENVDTSAFFGTVPLAVVGKNPGEIPYPGSYDIVYDADQNGIFDNGDNVDYITAAGFETTLPEFSTIAVPSAMALLAVMVFMRRQT
jgi:hypothetical protein